MFTDCRSNGFNAYWVNEILAWESKLAKAISNEQPTEKEQKRLWRKADGPYQVTCVTERHFKCCAKGRSRQTRKPLRYCASVS